MQIKIEPPDIRDIDEDMPPGWDSPGRLVIDMVSSSNPFKYLLLNIYYMTLSVVLMFFMGPVIVRLVPWYPYGKYFM